MSSVRRQSTPWETVLLVCGKCSRKLEGGYGPEGDDTLRNALRGALREAGMRRRVHVVETKCLGICPKKAVTALNASRPGQLVTIPKGMAPDAALAALIPGSGDGGPAG